MKQPNVLLFVWDAVRHDVCSCYGQEPVTTPVLDQIAKEGVLFEQVIAAAPWTLPAMSSIFTGMYPGQTNIYLRRELDRRFPTLAELLAKHGYATFGISNNDWLGNDFGLNRGFQTQHRLWQLVQTREEITNLSLVEKDNAGHALARGAWRRLWQGNPIKNGINTLFYKFGRYYQDYGAARTTRPLTNWISRQTKPWFAFVHYLETHLQYKPPLEFIKRYAHDLDRCLKIRESDQWRLCWRHNAGVEMFSPADLQAWRDLYLAEVAYTDHKMGQVLEWLRQTGQLDNTLIMVTADHGENLGDHGLLSHSYSLHRPLVQVPLVLRYPGVFAGGQRVSHLVQTIDLWATVLELAGIDRPDGVASESLVGLRPRRDYALSEYGTPLPPHAEAMARFGLTPEQLKHRQRGLTALQTTTHKLIVTTDGSEMLFDLAVDPDETNDVAEQHPDLVASLRQKLQQIWREQEIPGLIGLPIKQQMEIPADVEERLQMLGYLE